MTCDVSGSASWRNKMIENWNKGIGVRFFGGNKGVSSFLLSGSIVNKSSWVRAVTLLEAFRVSSEPNYACTPGLPKHTEPLFYPTNLAKKGLKSLSKSVPRQPKFLLSLQHLPSDPRCLFIALWGLVAEWISLNSDFGFDDQLCPTALTSSTRPSKKTRSNTVSEYKYIFFAPSISRKNVTCSNQP